MTSNRPRVAALAAGALLVSAGVVAAASPAAAHAPAGAQVYWSSESRTPGYAPKNRNWYLDPATGLAGTPYQLSRQADVRVTAATGAATIAVDPTQQYQKMLGVGSSLEESTVSNLAKMDPAARTKALKALVDPRTGAGFNVIRITFGTADFTSHDYYTYDDGSPDPTLSRFSIAQDVDYHIIGVLQEALRINPRIKFFGSAWSPPAWMKDNNSMIAGHLLTEWIPTLATYYRKALQAYAAYGIPIYGMTLQNEPEYSGTYPSTLVSAEQERQLAVALHAELVANHLQKTKLWAYDHNFRDIINYSAGVYGPPGAPTDAYPFVDGMAVHDYSGTPSQMGTVYNTYPGKDVLMTERSVWGTVGADRLIQYFRNGSTIYEGWVSMLDQNHAPTRWPGIPDPTMLVQSTTDPNTFWKLPDYYLIAQFSKFVQPGARRVFSANGTAATLTNVSFLNPDGTLVTIIVNQTATDQPFSLQVGGKQIAGTIPTKTVGTYLWKRAAVGHIAGSDGCVGARLDPFFSLRAAFHACDGDADQQFTVGVDGTLRTLGLCLTAAGSSVRLSWCTGSTAQQWKVSGGAISALGKCLDTGGLKPGRFASVRLATCTGGAEQTWRLPA